MASKSETKTSKRSANAVPTQVFTADCDKIQDNIKAAVKLAIEVGKKGSLAPTSKYPNGIKEKEVLALTEELNKSIKSLSARYKAVITPKRNQKLIDAYDGDIEIKDTQRVTLPAFYLPQLGMVFTNFFLSATNPKEAKELNVFLNIKPEWLDVVKKLVSSGAFKRLTCTYDKQGNPSFANKDGLVSANRASLMKLFSVYMRACGLMDNTANGENKSSGLDSPNIRIDDNLEHLFDVATKQAEASQDTETKVRTHKKGEFISFKDVTPLIRALDVTESYLVNEGGLDDTNIFQATNDLTKSFDAYITAKAITRDALAGYEQKKVMRLFATFKKDELNKHGDDIKAVSQIVRILDETEVERKKLANKKKTK